MPLCGPKLSTFGLVISIWGIVQLAITGVLFHNRSVAFIEDISLDDESIFSLKTKDQVINDINIRYDTSALNCWIAALMYVATLCISAQQFWSHGKTLDINAEM